MTMDDLIFIICGLSFLFSGFILYGWYLNKKGNKKKGKKSPSIIEKSETVKVISKASNMSGVYGATTTYFYVSFEFPDETRKNFQVEVKQYNSIAESETGILTYKEQKNDLMFIDFKPAK